MVLLPARLTFHEKVGNLAFSCNSICTALESLQFCGRGLLLLSSLSLSSSDGGGGSGGGDDDNNISL